MSPCPPAQSHRPTVQDTKELLIALLDRSGSGDAGAFSRLYRMTAPALSAYARKLARGWGCGDEVLQEAFLAIWLSARHYDAIRAAPLTWLRAIVRNKAFDLYRRSAARIPDAVEEWDPCTLRESAALPCERMQALQEAILLGRWLDDLGAEQRRAIELTWLQGMTHADAAISMGKPLGSIKTLVRRGLIRLRMESAHTAASIAVIRAGSPRADAGGGSGSGSPSVIRASDAAHWQAASMAVPTAAGRHKT